MHRDLKVGSRASITLAPTPTPSLFFWLIRNVHYIPLPHPPLPAVQHICGRQRPGCAVRLRHQQERPRTEIQVRHYPFQFGLYHTLSNNAPDPISYATFALLVPFFFFLTSYLIYCLISNPIPYPASHLYLTQHFTPFPPPPHPLGPPPFAALSTSCPPSGQPS